MHTSCSSTPSSPSTDVRVEADQVLGEIGGGYALTREWFVEERLMIGRPERRSRRARVVAGVGLANERIPVSRGDRLAPG